MTPSRTYILCVFLGGIAIGLVAGYAWHWGSVQTHPEIYREVGR